MKVYVGNIGNKVSKYNLKDMFEEYGKVISVKLIADDHKGYALVEMDNMHEARNAICELNGCIVKTKRIVVNEARETNYHRPNNYRAKYNNGNF